jgi:hypothetical protein
MNNYRQKWLVVTIALFLLVYFVLSSNNIKIVNSSNISSEAYPAPNIYSQNTQNFAYPAPVDSSKNTISYAYPPPTESSNDDKKTYSVEAVKVIEYLKATIGFSDKEFTLLSDRITHYPFLGKDFQVITLLDKRPDGKIFKYLVDKNTF